MGRRVPHIVHLFVSAIVTVAILASAPLFLGGLLTVLAANQPHSCGEPSR